MLAKPAALERMPAVLRRMRYATVAGSGTTSTIFNSNMTGAARHSRTSASWSAIFVSIYHKNSSVRSRFRPIRFRLSTPDQSFIRKTARTTLERVRRRPRIQAAFLYYRRTYWAARRPMTRSFRSLSGLILGRILEVNSIHRL